MDFIEIESSEDQIEETSVLAKKGIDDEPPVCPRIGDKYQVEIPALATGSEYLCMLDISSPFGIGLAVPIMWIQPVGDCIDHEKSNILGSKYNSRKAQSADSGINYSKSIYADEAGFADCSAKNKKIQIHATFSTTSAFPAGNSNQGLAWEVGSLDDAADSGEEFAATIVEGRNCVDNDLLSMGFWPLEAKGYSPLPCLSPTPSWSDVERQSFVLGLYAFGKDLAQVRKFMGCEKMGDVLSFYYGKFCGSDAHRRWAERRKMKSRKCIVGQRIFTGWRQQELLSRVLPTVSKGVQEALLEDAKAYNQGRASFVEFVFFLKAAVGMQVLVKAIGIGNGKHDLTRFTFNPVRTHQASSSHPEIPIGKACSSLTSGDIINFLTCGSRLSKARSNDLFWEAVWPRLIAKGWRSEQPKNPKHQLVFLVPGIKYFSRRKLVRGNHYFESVSDVLKKVASDPRILGRDVQRARASSSLKDIENGSDTDAESGRNGVSARRPRCHPRKRHPADCNPELMEFTVVDTSLVRGEGPSKVRKMRSMPADATHFYGQTKSDSSGDPLPGTDDSSSNDQGQGGASDAGKGTQSDQSNQVDQFIDLLKEEPPEKNYFLSTVHVPKRRRLTAYKYERSGSASKGRRLRKEEMELGQQKPSDTVSKEAEISSKGNTSSENDMTVLGDDGEGKSQSRPLNIDLNLPYVPLDDEVVELFSIETEGGGSSSSPYVAELREPGRQTESRRPDVMPSGDDRQPARSSRRQSTRIRPPTARVLEAFALGFLGNKRRGRDTNAPESSRRPRGGDA